MNKILLTIALLIQPLFSATSEQIEQYLLVSNAEEELLALETQYSTMQNSFSQDKNTSKNNTYDMQLISLRFKEYIEKNLSEDEMDEILQNYKNVIMLQYISALSTQSADVNTTQTYIKNLQADSGAAVRIGLIEEISNLFSSKESMGVLFDQLIKPLLQNGIGGKKMSVETMKSQKESYIKKMRESNKKAELYHLRDFSLEELESLLEIAKSSAVSYESKAMYGATAYALQEFFASMASRYDVKKHQRHSTEATQSSPNHE